MRYIYYENHLKNLNNDSGGTAMDWRLLIVLLPLLVAGGWALFNIGAAAIAQAQKFINEQN
jgi:photosystem II PsbY protein